MVQSRRALFCCLLLLVLFVYTVPAQAAGTSIKLLIDGQAIQSDVAPVISNNRTMVPLRVISEGLGAQVAWDGTTRTVRVALADSEILLGIGKATALVDNQEYKLDAPPVIIGNRTMVPLRFIGEALGAQVHWNATTRTVSIVPARAEVRQVMLKPELGREVLVIKGSGRLEGTVTQTGNQVIVTMPEAELLMPEGELPLSGELVETVSVRPLAPGVAKGVVVTFELLEPTPFTVTGDIGELTVVLPYQVEKLAYEQITGGEVLKIDTTGQVPYTVQQLAAPDRLVLNLPGITAGSKLRDLTPNSLLNQAVRVQDSPTGISIIIEQSRTTKYRVTATSSGLEVYFSPQISGFDYQPVPGGARVKIQTTGPLSHHVTRLKNPDRLVLDFQDTLLVATESVIDVNDQVVTQVRAGQFAFDPDVTRLVVELKSYLSHRLLTGDSPGELILELTTSPVQGRYIGIDAGHGGSEPGSVSPSGLKEKDINLDIARRVEAGLRAAGAKTFMIRNGDTTIDFRDRPHIANKENVEILVSIHCNSFADASKRGTEVYYFKDGHGGQELAETLHRALVNSLGLPDRGLRTADYNIIRHTKMPASLVEVAYLSNPVEEKLLADPAFREKAAQAIVSGIMNYFRGR